MKIFTSLKNKIICILLIVLLTVPISQGISKNIAIEKTDVDSLCYGFVVPLVEYVNDTVENLVNCEIKNMVNDILREQIPVYWASTDFNASIMNIDSENETEMSFKKGTFIIPFTGGNYNDTKLLTIVYDYNQSSEIEDRSTGISMYPLIDALSTSAYPLVEVKIAQCITPRSTGLNYYIEKAGKCGFLSYEMIETDELKDKLNNSAYNVIVWAAVPSDNLLTYYYKHLINDLKNNISNQIREFVSNGGGYVGSCYGAYLASYGVLPLPIFFKRRAYDPNLKSIGFFAISDVLTSMVFETLGRVKTEIIDFAHPVTYGLEYLPGEEKVLYDLHINGPKFVKWGENSQVIAKFYEANRRLDGSPAWMSSNFGDGKLVLFSGHPEMLDGDDHTEFLDMEENLGNGKKIISNAFLFTTSEETMAFNTVNSRNLTYIFNIWDQTSDLTESLDDPTNLFDDLKININETRQILDDLTDEANQILDLIKQIAEENNVDLNISFYYIGNLASYYLIYDLELFSSYFDDLEETLEEIERVYVLLNNDSISTQIGILKNGLSQNVNETKAIFQNGKNTSKACIEALLDYQQNKLFSSFKENKIEGLVREHYHNCEGSFFYVPKSYFNSLKLLRERWYDYESEI